MLPPIIYLKELNRQYIGDVWGSMIIQAVGVSGYFIGKLLSPAKPAFAVDWINIVGLLFMPVSMLAGAASILIFKNGQVAPYPRDIWHILVFALLYVSFCIVSFILLKKRLKNL